jgi:lipoprotein-anchoring transpeptidase ErfK/SrfK
MNVNVRRFVTLIALATLAGLGLSSEARQVQRANVPAPGAGSRFDAAASAAQLNASTATPLLVPGSHGPAVTRAQILFDRAWFSPGEIDGNYSTNMRRTVAAFQTAHGLTSNGRVDVATWNALSTDSAPTFAAYTVTEQDAAGPFTKIPADMMERAKLKSLDYETIQEALAERFHMSQKLLMQLNRGSTFKAGDRIVVADTATSRALAPGKAKSIEIDKSSRMLFVVDAQARVLAAFPVSIGGPLDPLPVGKMKITNEVSNPIFTYDPALIKSARAGDSKIDIQPGPNNPVGNMWLGLTKPHWGIHGTPNPSRLGREETNGCVHLANWDAQRLATIAKPGFVVDVHE